MSASLRGRAGLLTSLLLAATFVGCLGTPPHVHVGQAAGLGFSDPSVVLSGMLDGRPSWEATLPILKTVPGEPPAAWQDLAVSVQRYGDRNASRFPVEDGGRSAGAGIRAWYMEANGSSMAPDVGDSIVLSGLDRTHQGAKVKVLLNDTFVGSIALPSEFDGRLGVRLEGPWITIRDSERGPVDVAIAVKAMEPADERVPWGSVQVGFVPTSGSSPFLLGTPVIYPPSSDVPRDRIRVWRLGRDANGTVTVGDTIVVTGLERADAGRAMGLYTGTAHVGGVTLPSSFPSNATDVRLVLKPPTVEPWQVNGTGLWRAWVNIDKIEPVGALVLWPELRVRVTAIDGAVLLEDLVLTEPPGGADPEWTTIETAVPQAWYVEATPGPMKMDAGDAILLTGMTAGFEGATLELSLGSTVIGATVMPSTFP